MYVRISKLPPIAEIIHHSIDNIGIKTLPNCVVRRADSSSSDVLSHVLPQCHAHWAPVMEITHDIQEFVPLSILNRPQWHQSGQFTLLLLREGVESEAQPLWRIHRIEGVDQVVTDGIVDLFQNVVLFTVTINHVRGTERFQSFFVPAYHNDFADAGEFCELYGEVAAVGSATDDE